MYYFIFEGVQTESLSEDIDKSIQLISGELLNNQQNITQELTTNINDSVRGKIK